MKSLLAMIDRNEAAYWLGLAMLFAGLWLGVSVATALSVTGACMAVESVLTSYLAAWMSMRQPPAGRKM